MHQRMLISIDAPPDSPDDSLGRTVQFATMAGCSVHLLHVARAHIVPGDISAGAGLGVRVAQDDVDSRERQVVQDAGDTLAAAGHRGAWRADRGDPPRRRRRDPAAGEMFGSWLSWAS